MYNVILLWIQLMPLKSRSDFFYMEIDIVKAGIPHSRTTIKVQQTSHYSIRY